MLLPECSLLLYVTFAILTLLAKTGKIPFGQCHLARHELLTRSDRCRRIGGG